MATEPTATPSTEKASVKLSVPVSQLKDILAPAEKVIARTVFMPVIRCFLFRSQNHTLEVLTTNIDQSVRAKLELPQPIENLQIAVPAKTLMDLIKTLQDDLTIDLEFQQNPPTLIVHAPSGQYQIGGEDPYEFPVLPTPPADSLYTIPASTLRLALESTLYAAFREEDNVQFRPLTGVLFESHPEEGVRIVASDVRRLVIFPVPEATPTEQKEIIIPRKAIQILKSILPTSDTPVSIAVDDKNAYFQMEHLTFITHTITDPYPNYRVVQEESPFPNQMRASLEDLDRILKRLTLFAGSTGIVEFHLSPSQGIFSAEDPEQNNRAEERPPVTYEGEELKLRFDIKFFSEVLNNFPEDDVIIAFGGIARPVEIYPADPQARPVKAYTMPIKEEEQIPTTEATPEQS